MTITPTALPPALDLMDSRIYTEGRQDSTFRALRAADPVHWQDANDNGPGFWSLTRYQDIRDAAADPERLSSAQGTQIFDRKVEGHGKASLHNMDDPEHAALRKITVPYLRAVKIQQWNEVIASTTHHLFDDAVAAGEFDLVDTVAAKLPMLVLSRVLGVDEADAPRMVDWTNRLTSSDPDHQVDSSALETTRSELFDYFRWLSDQRRAEPTNDLVSILVNGSKDGSPLTWDELAAYYVVLVAAGNETTRHLVSGGTIALAENPGTWQRVIDDESLLPTAVEEMFRYVSPVAAMRRTATVTHEIGGSEVQEGDKVVLWFAAGNRDPEVFEHPEVFDITRTPNEHITFGWGVHFCLGTHLARAELRSYFGEQRARRIDFELTGEPVRVRNNLFRGWSSVPVRIVQR
ncbi:cytochrome [Subtercola boreus]|uniref:Cytochrome n=1 Tax=Subtercola boreus TaxID=120213 RepID=A0A3E0VLN1_9MICO|nr:cytochrome P450 [Subtercola boreus]RFA10378.1 cytochrome [Subtercola boreus]TQL56106.1 cytochrome P450 [Subtercola boreus]